MKVIHNKNKDKITETRKKEELDAIFIGNMTKKKGQRIYELELFTGRIVELEPKSVDAELVEKRHLHTGESLGKTTVTKDKYTYRNNCMYIQATNMKNAKRKFQKRVESMMEAQIRRQHEKSKENIGNVDNKE